MKRGLRVATVNKMAEFILARAKEEECDDLDTMMDIIYEEDLEDLLQDAQAKAREKLAKQHKEEHEDETDD